MNTVKNLIASKTVITAFVGVLLAAAQVLGYVDPSVTVAMIEALLFTAAGFFRFIATDKLVVTSPA